MKKTKKRALYIVAALLAAVFVLACLAGFAACGGSEDCAHENVTWDETKTVDATCGEDGLKTGTCDDCGETVTEVIPATGNHTLSKTDAVPATCTTGGNNAYWTCSVCEKVFSDEAGTTETSVEQQTIGKLSSDGKHTVVGTYANSTWTYTCSVCNATIDLTTDAAAIASVTLQASDEASLTAAAAWTDVSGVVPTVVVQSDIALSKTMTITAAVTLDLNGFTLSSGTTTTSTDETSGETTTTTSGWTPVVADSNNGVVSDVMISVGEGASLTIEDSSEEETGEIAYTYVGPTVDNVFGSTTYNWNKAGNHGAAIMVDGDSSTSVTIESGTITTTSVGIRAKNGEVTINGGVIYSTGYYVIWEDTGKTDVTINDGLIYGDWGGILVDGDSRFKGSYSEGAVTTLTVNGGVVYSGDAENSAIRTENQGSIDSAIINVYGGYVICADNPQSDTNYEAGIFIGNGTLTIADGTDENGDVTSSPVIMGPTAIEVQGGTTTISGGTIISNATGDQSIQSVTSSDPFTYGYALAIYPRANISSSITGYTAKTDVTISGGTFVGDIYAIATANGTTDSTWNVSFTKDATGGTTQNYVITIDVSLGITLTPYDSSDNPISNPTTGGTDVVYYLWTYVDSNAEGGGD